MVERDGEPHRPGASSRLAEEAIEDIHLAAAIAIARARA